MRSFTLEIRRATRFICSYTFTFITPREALDDDLFSIHSAPATPRNYALHLSFDPHFQPSLDDLDDATRELAVADPSPAGLLDVNLSMLWYETPFIDYPSLLSFLEEAMRRLYYDRPLAGIYSYDVDEVSVSTTSYHGFLPTTEEEMLAFDFAEFVDEIGES